MKWPVPQDFNEAVQTPGLAFSDPDLKAGAAVVGAQGLPLPRSGNFADVYQIRSPDGRDWAVKCFTRPVVGLDQRYKKIDEQLRESNLPFAIGFDFLPEGIRVHGKWYPAVKMEWIEGLLLNQFVRENASKPHVLDALFQMWVRLSRRMRDLSIAHADLQHGNVLLVPGSRSGSLGLKLIDYDGMCIPALANQPSGELGHANFQHPDRAAKQIFSQDLDRFPHLVIATALKGLAVLGPSLWERYDTGENLLFVEADFMAPAKSRLMKELIKSGDPTLVALASRLATASKRPIPQTPWLDAIAPEGVVKPLSAEETRDSRAAFEIGTGPGTAPANGPQGARALPPPVGTRPNSLSRTSTPISAPSAEFKGTRGVAPPAEWHEVEVVEIPPRGADTATTAPLRTRMASASAYEPAQTGRRSAMPLYIGGVLGLLVLGGAVAFLASGSKPTVTADATDNGEEIAATPTKPEEAAPPVSAPVAPVTPAPVQDTLQALDVPGLPVRWRAAMPPPISSLQSLAFNRNGSRVAVTQLNQSVIKVLDTQTGFPIGEFTGHEQPVIGVAALPDGKFVSLGVNEPHALVWDPASIKAQAKIPLDNPINRAPALFEVSPDGRYLALAKFGPPGQPGTIAESLLTVTEIETGRKIVNVEMTLGAVRFTTDGAKMVIAEDRGRFRIVPLGETGGETIVTEAATGAIGNILSISPDGTRVVATSAAPNALALSAQVYETASGNAVAGASFPIYGRGSLLDFSADGKWLFAPRQLNRGRSFGLVLYDTSNWKPVAAGRMDSAPISNVGTQLAYFSPDNKSLIVLKPGSGLQTFDLPREGYVVLPPDGSASPPGPGTTPPNSIAPLAADAPKPRWAVADNFGITGTVAFSADDQILFVNGSNGRVATYDVRTGKPGATYPPGVAQPGPRLDLQPLQNGTVLLSTFNNSSHATWDPRTGQTTNLKFPALPPTGQNTSSGMTHRISPNGQFAVVAHNSSFEKDPNDPQKVIPRPAPFRVFNLATGQPIISFDWRSGTARFTSDSSRLLVAERSGVPRWFKLPSGEADGELPLPVVPNTFVTIRDVSADGKTILLFGTPTTGGTGTFAVDVATGQIVGRFPPGSYSVLSEDGRIVGISATKSKDGQISFAVNLFETNGGKPLVSLSFPRVRPTPPPAIALSADGRLLAVYRSEGETSLYDLGTIGGVVMATPPPAPATPPVPDPASNRKPLPSDAALAKATENVRAILKADYAKRQPADRKAFSQKLQEMAGQTTDDAVARYVMLRDARDFAIEAGEPALALQAVDTAIKLYDLDATEYRIQVTERMQAGMSSAAALRGLVDQAIQFADLAWDSDEYEPALKFSQIAAAAARKGNYAAGGEEADAHVAQLRKLRDTALALKPAFDQIAKVPSDPEANLAVGKYRCFVLGRWEAGVKNLALGSDKALKDLAALEAEAATPGNEIKAADAWWDYAQAAPEDEKRAAQIRAISLYRKAIPTLSGLAKARAETRLEFTMGGTEYRPGLLAEFSSLTPAILKGKKARIDPQVDFTGGDFAAPNSPRRAALTVRWKGLLLPPAPGRYKLVAKTEDPVRLKVDNKTLIDTFATRTGKKEAVIRYIDRTLTIQIEYQTFNTPGHRLQLFWVPTGAPEQLVPADALYHDRKTEPVVAK